MKNLKKLVQKTLVDEAWFTENAEGMGAEPFSINDDEDTNNYVNDIMENVIDGNDDFDIFSKKQIKTMVREVYLELADEYNKKTMEASEKAQKLYKMIRKDGVGLFSEGVIDDVIDNIMDSNLLEPMNEIVFKCEKQPGWSDDE